MTAIQLLEWQNLPFVLPFVAAVIYLLLLAFGMAPDHDHDVDVDADFDADADTDFDHGVEHAIGHDGHGHEHEPHSAGLAAKFMSVLGLGKVPLSFLVMSFCFIWGFSGWLSNMILDPILRFPVIYFWVSVAAAAVSSVTFTGQLARVLGKIMPSTETYGVKEVDFVGRVAEVRFPITPISGTACLYDDQHSFQEVQCRVQSDGEKIPIGARVVLMRYDETEKIFIARREAQGLRLN